MTTTGDKPYIMVDGCPCVISVAYVTGGGPGEWGCIRYIGEYTCMKELNKDMPKFIREIPSPHWRIEIDFQDYYEDCDDGK